MKLRKLPQKLRRKAQVAVRGGTTRLRRATMIEPPAVADKPSGIIRPDTGNLILPESLMEASDERPRKNLPGPFMIVITILAIAFISVIAWFVSRMPGK